MRDVNFNQMTNKVTSLPQLDIQIQSTRERNLSDSLEQCKEELRDAYMNFKDLQQRCVINMKDKGSKIESGIEEHAVFYFKPETFVLDDPEKQRIYRESLLQKIGNIPKPEPISYLGDELHRSMCQTIADRSTPKLTKQMLAQYFLRRQYSLQHMKYKLLCRWAHHTLTSESLEMISPEASFLYGKLEYNLEQAMVRHERLSQNDYFDTAKPENRPSTKADLGDGALYVENFDIPAQSLIREDDIEVYVRGTTYRNKINKVVNKFFSRLKWLALNSRYKVFENAIQEYFAQKNANIKRQEDLHDRVKSHSYKTQIMTADIESQLTEALKNYHCKRYKRQFLSESENILFGWKANHDEVPRLISDTQLLKIKILETASQFKLTGDIELDKGFSFSYQVAVFFPSYFQKQILKSQFSLYDAFEVNQEQNDPQQNVNISMTYIDSNIFNDVSSARNALPTDESLQTEFKDANIKIIRVKSAAYWLYYVALTPSQTDWQQKQEAVLNSENPIDSLLKQAFNYLDVNDLVNVNRINEDNSHLHRETITRLIKNDPHNHNIQINVQTNDGEKQIEVDTLPFINSDSEAANVQSHLIKVVQNQRNVEKKDGEKEQGVVTGPSIHSLPSHLLTAFYTLRFMISRDAKTRVLYTLNYFRSIQKRLALDLREFATRDRIDGQASNSFVQSREANQAVVNNVSMSSKQHEKQQAPATVDTARGKDRMTVFDSVAIAELKNMASLRNYKNNGFFNNKVFMTSPQLQKFHAAYGEPIVYQSVAEEQDRQQLESGVNENSVKLMGRIDFVEIDENMQEVYIKDDFGIYIIYDCVFQDMTYLEEDLCKVGSYYLHRSEVLLDPNSKPIPCRDRQQLVDDLLGKEADYQFQKVKLVQVYMECYEHIVDPLEQQKLMQIITDIMARRPRFNLQANYFIDAYDSEIKLIKKQFQLVKMLVDLQISLEKTENQRMQEALNLSYSLANLYSKNKWQYQDAEQLLQAIEKTRQQKIEAEMFAKKMNLEREQQEAQRLLNENQKSKQNDDSKVKKIKRKDRLDDHLSSNDESEEETKEQNFQQSQFGQQNESQFTQLLGLPKISIETIYQSYREKDLNVIKLMREHSNFISVYEGYPEFLTLLTQSSILDHNRIFKVNKWSQQTGALDFYDSLDFINRFHSLSQQISQELYDNLKMWDATLMTEIDYQVALLSIEELRQVISFQDNTVVEYAGRELLEDESIMGSSDKLIFYAKEMIGDLTCKPKHVLDPFIIAKLDVQTIHFFKWPQIYKAMNKYTMRKNGIAGIDYLMHTDKHFVTESAKEKAPEEDAKAGAQSKVADVLNRRNITVPSLLQTYSNMAELLRLRQEIILAASECSILKQIYVQQCEIVGLRDKRVELSDGINFTLQDSHDQDANFVNFFEHGSSHIEKIDLAAREFDPALLSNINFRNPDSFKVNILTSGLEEVRALLNYQILQKHLLIVATRINSIVIDPYARAFSELNIVLNSKIIIPNSIIDNQKLFPLPSSPINLDAIKNLRQIYKQSASSNCQPIFFNVFSKKSQSRSSIAKEYSNYQEIVQQKLDSRQCVSRVMRCFKVKLLNKLVQNTLIEVYLDAQKVQALQSCSRLRLFNRYFKFDPKSIGIAGDQITVFKHETSTLIENFPYNYLPDEWKELFDVSENYGLKKQEEFKVINQSQYEILDHSGIPSSSTLMSIDSCPAEDCKLFKEKQKSIRTKYWGKEDVEDYRDQQPALNDPEIFIKQMLPTFTPDENIEFLVPKKKSDDLESLVQKKIGFSAGSLLDYEEAVYFGDSKYAQMSRFYVFLERIITIEWFIKQLQLKPVEAVHFNNSIECGLQYFQTDKFDSRAMQQLEPIQKTQNNKLSQQEFESEVVALRVKRQVGETVHSLAIQIQKFLAQYNKTKKEMRFDYLKQYTEFRYQQVLGSFHRLIQQFYIKKNLNAVKQLKSAIAQLTKMDHLRVVYLKPHNYSIKDCCVAPQLQNLETGNLIFGSLPLDEWKNFQKCIQPILNQKALEPPQISLFQSLYQQDAHRLINPSQFAGQAVSTNNSIPFQCLQTALIGLSQKERKYCQSYIISTMYQANDFMETVYNDSSLATQTNEDVYSLDQLIIAKKFVNESSSALLLKQALMCWIENSTLPQTIEKFQDYEQNFRQHFFWKQLQQKEEIAKKTAMISVYGSIPSKEDLKVLKDKIDQMVNDQNISTVIELQKRDDIVRALREEFASIKKKVILDDYFNTKAEIQVFQNEIEKLIIKASIRTLDSESAALAKCFTLQVPSVQYHIHPFQQFAATFFDQVDPNLNLDVCNKVNSIQELLTKFRNRGTEVQTLTSGPGIVLTLKDINEIMVDFCRTAISEYMKEVKSRSEIAGITEGNLRNLLYIKDQKIKNLEHRIYNTVNNIDSIVISRQFEKGNQLIYELDCSNRLLSIFKSTMQDLETRLTKKILGQQLNKFKRKENLVEMKNQKFNDYKDHIVNMIEHDFAAEQDKIKSLLKDKAELAKNIDRDTKINKKVLMYPATGTNTYSTQTGKQSESAKSGILPGSVVPQGFKHYTHCFCFVPNKKYPWPSMELAELDMLSEQEARSELARLAILIRKQRLLYRTKEMCLMTKYQNKINILESQQNSNTILWDQLVESERREKALKQELAQQQQNFSTAQRKIESLQNDIRVLDSERCRLLKQKNTKNEQMKELLEVKKTMEVFDHVDNDKLIRALTKKDTELKALQNAQQNFDSQIGMVQRRREIDIKKYKNAFMAEQVKTQQILSKMEQLKLELKMIENNDTSVSSIWKKKSLDLFEVCQQMRRENEELKNRCFELINQGIQLTENLSQSDEQLQIKQSHAQMSKERLPDIVRTPFTRQVTSENQLNLRSATSTLGHHQQKSVLERNKSPDQHPNMVYNPSMNIGSDETNIPSEGVLHMSVRGLKSPELNRGKSVMQLNQSSNNKSMTVFKPNNQLMMSPSPYMRPSDIMTILNKPSAELYANELSARKLFVTEQQTIGLVKKNQIQGAVQRRQMLSSNRQESSLQAYTQMSSESQLANGTDSPALMQLKNVNRFSKQMQPVSFDVHGQGYSSSQISPVKRHDQQQAGKTVKNIKLDAEQIYGVSSEKEIQTNNANVTPNKNQTFDLLKSLD